MTRATLLRLLAHPTALNGADVRALEELAEAFPYCQTAHLLLAKAAHDHGSMLAGQRLRRAATYAAHRTLLRQLIEAAPVEETLEPAAAEAAMNESVAVAGAFAESNRLASSPFEAAPAAPAAPLVLEDKPAQEIGPAPAAAPASPAAPAEWAASAEEVPATLAGPAPGAEAPATNEATSVPVVIPELVSAAPPTAATTAAPAVAPEPLAEETAAPAAPTEEYHPAAPAESAAPAADEAAELTALASEAPLPDDAPGELAQPTPPADEDEAPASADALPQPAATDASALEELPVQAPPIRPPAEAEVASQEFGLALEEPAEVIAYQLPELELAITIPLAPAAATPRVPAFAGVPDVAYAPGEGSRYGFCLVPVAEASEPLMPAASLPPAGEFFLPDALLLAHLAEPPALPTTTTTDLINSFLQRAPRAQRQRIPAATSSPQADLSVRSTRTTPDLASESLAKILVKQGKVEQAIAVYERLMVKMPEKSAIFAAEIETLRPSA